MCSIFGYVTNKEEELDPILIEAAKRLTYRGYDTVGAATAKAMPDLAKAIQRSLRGGRGRGVAPWEAG